MTYGFEGAGVALTTEETGFAADTTTTGRSARVAGITTVALELSGAVAGATDTGADFADEGTGA